MSNLSPSRSKRMEKKSLPEIHNKPIPLHHVASKKDYHGELLQDHSPELWAYVPSARKYCQPTLNHSNSRDYCKKSTYTTDSRVTPSVTLLEKYFQRKHRTKLKSLVKIINSPTDNGNSSIGYEGISLYSTRLNLKDENMDKMNAKMKKQEHYQFQLTQTLNKSNESFKHKKQLNIKRKTNLLPYYYDPLDNYFADRANNHITLPHY